MYADKVMKPIYSSESCSTSSSTASSNDNEHSEHSTDDLIKTLNVLTNILSTKKVEVNEVVQSKLCTALSLITSKFVKKKLSLSSDISSLYKKIQ